jgi:pimeloyl-ACP methyl ester carboxylesterase
VPHIRRLLGCSLGLLAVAASHAPAQQTEELPGVRMVEVGGRATRIQVLGLANRQEGAPVVVFEAGATNALEIWGDVLPQLAQAAPVVAYDRAGLGRSEWDRIRPTPGHVAGRLRELLQVIRAEPPYVLVGYSWGGVLARYFAGEHPSDVAGLVFVDPSPIVTQRLEESLVPFEAIGSGRDGHDAYWSAFGGLFERAAPAVRAEFEVLRGLMELDLDERDVPPLPDVPVTLIVAAKYLPLVGMQLPFDPEEHFEADLRHRIDKLQDWALESRDGLLVVSNSTTHAVPREAPDLIVWAVRRVLTAVRGLAGPSPPSRQYHP